MEKCPKIMKQCPHLLECMVHIETKTMKARRECCLLNYNNVNMFHLKNYPYEASPMSLSRSQVRISNSPKNLHRLNSERSLVEVEDAGFL